MVIALLALSLVMIVGGVAAVVQGFPYVRLESGLAMVIGGTTAASAGAVLLGLAALMLQLKKLASASGTRGNVVSAAPADPIAVPATPTFRAPAFETPPPVAVEPVAATAGAAGLAGISLGGVRDLLGTGDTRPAIDPLPGRSVELEPPLPNLLPPVIPGPVAPPAPGEPINADEDLFAASEDHAVDTSRATADEPASELHEPDPAQEELALRPAFADATTAPEIESAAEEPVDLAEPKRELDEDAPKSDALQVVGTYASGANTYVMFANGTIQADTPRGQFTFQSLDELKEFVDSGGETNARGAA